MTTLDPKADLISRLRKGHEAITSAPGARYYHVPPTKLELEAAEFLSALPAQPAAVKPLDWQKRNGRDEWFADCVVGRYEVGDVRLRVAAVLRHVTGNDADDDTVGRFDTFDLAKAGAQADYEARIRSALAAPFQQEGVTEEMAKVAGAVIEKEVGVFADMSPSFYPWLARQALEAALVDRDRMQPHA